MKICHGREGDVNVDIYDYTGRERLASHGVRNEYVKDIVMWAAPPVIHIKEITKRLGDL